MAFDQTKFLARFVDEAREHCSRISDGLLGMESSSGDGEALNSLFRSAHTIKGSARMMKQVGVSELAHRMEDVLDALRSGRISLTHQLSNALFRGVDSILAMLDLVKADAAPPEPPAELLQLLEATAANSAASADTNETAAALIAHSLTHPHPNPPPEGEGISTAPDTPSVAVKSAKVDYLRINAVKLDELIRLMGEIVSEQGRFGKQIARLYEVGRAVTHQSETIAGLSAAGAIGADAARNLALQMEQVAASLRQTVRGVADSTLLQNHLVHELQDTSLTLRMQPLSNVFDPLRRTVRDIAEELGKEIDFTVAGGETELDRKIIERIGDSLIHLIRNSLDHGLESAAERAAAGKPPHGCISLSAYYDSGCVTIALTDDGKGLSLDAIRNKALAKGLFDAETLDHFSRAEIINLIFLPGFSTSPIITDLSGRGVGMDVVRKNIVDDLKGSIVVESNEGEGTRIFLRLPLNLAIFSLCLVSVAGKVFALSTTSLAEMRTLNKSDIIEVVNKRAIRLREQLVPIEELAKIIDLHVDDDAGRETMMLLIVRDGNEKLGLIVDEILGQEEMVVKPLPHHLKNLPTVSGVTIGYDDAIIPVLHVPELFRCSHNQTGAAGKIAAGDQQRTAAILVVDDSLNTREIEKSILEAYGYQIMTAEDGEEAWDLTRSTLYDLVVTDVEMPRLDGFSLTERLRGDPRYRSVPIIIVTSREKDEDKKRGITVGADAYIVKGAFDQSKLLDTVRTLIGG